MSRSFVVAAESLHAVDRVHRTFGDENYWRSRLVALAIGTPTLDSLRTDADGNTDVAMTLSFGSDQLPAPLNRVPGGVLRVQHRERWHPPDGGGMRGEITVDGPRVPVSGHCAISLTPVPNGSQFACDGAVSVNLPLVGRSLAKLIAGPVADWIRAIHDFTDAWITEHG